MPQRLCGSLLGGWAVLMKRPSKSVLRRLAILSDDTVRLMPCAHFRASEDIAVCETCRWLEEDHDV
jgi:hypothetical protein